MHSQDKRPVKLATDFRNNNATALLHHRAAGPAGDSEPARPDIPFASFQEDNYGDRKVEGTAFGKVPVKNSD